VLAFNKMLAELNDIAGQHEAVAEKLTSIVIASLQSSIHEIKQERKKVGNHGFLAFCKCSCNIVAVFIYCVLIFFLCLSYCHAVMTEFC